MALPDYLRRSSCRLDRLARNRSRGEGARQTHPTPPNPKLGQHPATSQPDELEYRRIIGLLTVGGLPCPWLSPAFHRFRPGGSQSTCVTRLRYSPPIYAREPHGFPTRASSDWPTPLLSHLLIVRDDDPLRPEMTWQPPRRATRIIRLHRTRPPCWRRGDSTSALEPGNPGHVLGGGAWTRCLPGRPGHAAAVTLIHREQPRASEPEKVAQDHP